MSSMEALVLQPFASGGMLSVQSHMHTTQDIPLSSVLKPDSCLTVTVTVICALAYLISLYPHRQPLWKGPFLRRLAPLESLPVELQETKLPLWKHLSLLTLSFLLAATQCAWSAWKALDASGVSYTLYPLPYLGSALGLLLAPPVTPPYPILAFYSWSWLITLPNLFLATHLNLSLGIDIASITILSLLVGLLLSLPISKLFPQNSAVLGKAPSIETSFPEERASLWSFISSTYLQPLLSNAARHTLEDDECWNLSPTFWHRYITPAVQSIQASSLLKQYLLANSFDISIHIALKILEACLNFTQPILLKQILNHFNDVDVEDADRDTRSILFLVFFSLLVGIGEAIVAVFAAWHIRRAYERNRGALMCSVVEKALRRSNIATTIDAEDEDPEHKHANVGQVFNLVHGDAYAFSQWIWDGIGRAVAAPVEIALAILSLYYIVGPATFASLAACLVVAIPLIPLAKWQISLSRRHLRAKDVRVDLVTELVESIRLLKNFAWEGRWLNKSRDARQKELRLRLRSNLVDAGTNLVILFIPTAMLLAVFFALTQIQGRSLTVPVAFASLAMITKLSAPLLRLPDAWMFLLRTLVVVRRLEDLFAEEDQTPLPSTPLRDGHWELSSSTTTIRWPSIQKSSQETNTFQLRIPTLRLPEKGLVLLSGPSSSGKSLLLQGLMGEATVIEGKIYQPAAPSPYALCTQTPWLESKAIRDNITYFEPFERSRYDAITKACALEQDFSQFACGDLTEIGERGVSLSGGQRMRVSLARALYRRSAIVLLDDPLAALDAATANIVFHRAILGIACQERLVIMSTHQNALCQPFACALIDLDQGSASLNKQVPQLLKSVPLISTPPTGLLQEQPTSDPQHFMTTETRAKGEVQLAVYRTYLESAGWWLWGVLLFLLLGARGIQVLGEIVLKWWGEAPQDRNWLPIFLTISLVSVFGQFLRVLVNLWASYRAANTLFDRCLSQVVAASQRWFDITPVGRVLNRLVADTTTADSTISSSIRSFLETGLVFCTSLVMIMVLLPSFLPVACALLLFYIALSKGYRHASRDLRRLGTENKSRSPMFSLIGECFAGLSIVRAFGKSRQYMDQMYNFCDKFQAYDHAYWLAVFWLRFRFDTLGRLSIAALEVGCVVFGISQGWSAFAIVQAEAFVQAVHAVVWAAAQLQLDLNAVERIEELLHLDPEETSSRLSPTPPAYWPSTTGGIEIEGLSFKYAAESPPIVTDLNLCISPRCKLAIVGRTGSGKSTLAASLLRVRDPSHGTIHIDGLDITNVPLQDLRGRISVVPQEPTLFIGSIRFNLDPLQEHSDEECLRILRLMGATCSLDDTVAPEGRNFSAGQRNLIALARAVLRNSSILILDESTANLDWQSDKRVQQVIKDEFKDRIVISIAHRVSTIVDFDQVIVMEEGSIIQKGIPRELSKVEGPFRDLCIASGDLASLKVEGEAN